MLYQIDDCASFAPDQIVEYRADGDRIYIRRDNGKEHKCRIEGAKKDASPTAQ